MLKSLFAMPFVAFLLIAAVPPKETAVPAIPIIPPADITADPNNRLTLELSNGGTVIVLLRPDAAPAHVERVRTLARQGFYAGTTFHRVIPGFMAQGGDPTGTGTGGSQLPDLKAEFNSLPHLRGTVAAARTDAPDTANSQFFIMLGRNGSIDKRYSVFGRVTFGMDAVDRIAVGEPPEDPTRIVRATIGGEATTQASPTP